MTRQEHVTPVWNSCLCQVQTGDTSGVRDSCLERLPCQVQTGDTSGARDSCQEISYLEGLTPETVQQLVSTGYLDLSQESDRSRRQVTVTDVTVQCDSSWPVFNIEGHRFPLIESIIVPSV